MRSSVDHKIAGVCGGIAEYLEIDSTIVRLVWVIMALLPIPVVPAVIGYFVAWIIMPWPLCRRPRQFNQSRQPVQLIRRPPRRYITTQRNPIDGALILALGFLGASAFAKDKLIE